MGFFGVRAELTHCQSHVGCHRKDRKASSRMWSEYPINHLNTITSTLIYIRILPYKARFAPLNSKNMLSSDYIHQVKQISIF